MGSPSGLRIDTPPPNAPTTLAPGHSSASTSAVSPSTSDSGSFQFPPPPKSRSRNMKKLSLTLSTQSSSSSLAFPPHESLSDDRSRCTSISSMLYRRDEDGSPTVPYPDGPIEILPKIWLGAEDNVRDWRGLVTRRIGSVLNVAKEVTSPFDLSLPAERTPLHQGAYYPADGTGRPPLHYLKLQWSHGQSDLVQRGFPEAMAFVDQSIARGEGILIHCQCGISRSATLVIALVMRAASLGSPWVPQEVRDLKGWKPPMHMSNRKANRLIYQLMEYDKLLRGPCQSPTPSSSEAEWIRRRKLADDASDRDDVDQEVQREAKALDKAMEDRILARKSSSSSVGSGIGMGPAWKSRYSSRKRTASIASNMTSNSMLSENLVEEDEEQELLGVGGGFDKPSARPSPLDGHAPSDVSSDGEPGSSQVSPSFPTSAPSTKSSFKLPPVPATALKPIFDTSRRCMSKSRRRPTPLDILPTVPDSPVHVAPTPTALVMPRSRKESRATIPTSLQLRKSSQSAQLSQAPNFHKSTLQTPSQTLFVFPPSPNLSTCTPSAMTVTSNTIPVPFPSSETPRSRSDSRRRSLIGLMTPPTPTTAHARVDARGWVGIH
ncbi:hypothetical protein F5148DRAFT_1277190 [Russula earlei]|uniref:Uncharacterized protein n=1 Tax=Russula earlei TaxID=71964 RepID=A0ACC0U086_9AGAM|nr:hypothetical protein F5148DRAFT_1277190 [Russula earlei]